MLHKHQNVINSSLVLLPPTFDGCLCVYKTNVRVKGPLVCVKTGAMPCAANTGALVSVRLSQGQGWHEAGAGHRISKSYFCEDGTPRRVRPTSFYVKTINHELDLALNRSWNV